MPESQVPDILKATQPAGATRPLKTISSAYEPHMGVYIDAQDKYAAYLPKYRIV